MEGHDLVAILADRLKASYLERVFVLINLSESRSAPLECFQELLALFEVYIPSSAIQKETCIVVLNFPVKPFQKEWRRFDRLPQSQYRKKTIPYLYLYSTVTDR